MKYCQECGTKLEENEKHATLLKTKEETNSKNRKLLKAAGTMIIISAVISIFIGVIGITASWEYSYDGYYYTSSYNYYPLKLMAGIFGLFGLILGFISGVSTYTRKMFSLALVGLGFLFIVVAFCGLLGLYPFIMFGVPILIMGTISAVFTCISRKEFAL